MRRSKMKHIRAILHELVIVRKRIDFSLCASGQIFISIDGSKYSVLHRGKHRSEPRGMQAERLVYDDAEFMRLSVPPTVLSYGSKQFTKDAIAAMSESRPIVKKLSDIQGAPEDLVPRAPAIESSDQGFYLQP